MRSGCVNLPLAWSDRAATDVTNTLVARPGDASGKVTGRSRARLVAPERRPIVPRSSQLPLATPTGPPCRARLDLVGLSKQVLVLVPLFWYGLRHATT